MTGTPGPVYRLIYGSTLVVLHIAATVRAVAAGLPDRTERAENRAARRARSRWVRGLDRWDDAQMEGQTRMLGDEQ